MNYFTNTVLPWLLWAFFYNPVQHQYVSEFVEADFMVVPKYEYDGKTGSSLVLQERYTRK